MSARERRYAWISWSDDSGVPVGPVEATDAVYLYVHPLPAGSYVHRTVEIQPGLLVDLTDDGRILGVERIDGPIGVAELVTVLTGARWPHSTVTPTSRAGSASGTGSDTDPPCSGSSADAEAPSPRR